MPVADGGGSNGKSTLLEAVGAALGEYAAAAPAKLIMRTHNDEHPTIKADLMGKRLVWISETEEGGSLRMEQLKALTGGDRIKARFMRADYFEFNPTHTLIIATNHRPNVNSTEHAAWRRLRLVPFPYTYRSPEDCEGDDRPIDKRLRVRLRDGKAQRSAMLAWLVAGAVKWNAEGLPECPTITEATGQWRRSEDVILRFIEDRLRLGVGARTRGGQLWDTYRDWCDQEGRNAGSSKNFITKFMAHEDVQNAGIDVVRPQGVAHYRGVEIRGIPAI
ncbi:MAG: phage/plasmid primase, P4 family [Microthrixaceae bacterium]